MSQLILASASPRREELLKHLNLDFEIITEDIEETFNHNLDIKSQIENIAFNKANVVYQKHQDKIVIGADTVIIFEDEIIGKPHTKENAIKILERLSGKSHIVLTAVAIISKEKTSIFASETEVEFYDLSHQEIIDYVDTLEPLDKAGAYTIQGLSSIFIKKINGDYYSVMGLPIAKLYQVLKEEYKLNGSFR